MPLEAGTFLDELVASNPVGSSDNIDKGDDHLRLIKSLLKNSFPDVDQAVSTVISNLVAPPLKRKGTLWADETADLLKIRNKTDNAWITLAVDLLVSNKVDVNSGEIDGTPVGANVQSGGDFDAIGEVVRGTGKFTTMDFSGKLTAPGFIDAGTVMVFYQASVPTGWTQVTTQNNKAMRIVNGVGGGSGGSSPFTTVFTATRTVVGTDDGHAITIAEMPAHDHTYVWNPSAPRSGGGVNGGSSNPTRTTGLTGGGGTHSHTFTSDSFNLDVEYSDMIIGSLDA